VSEPQVSPIPREARAYQGHRAGLITRLFAATIDLVVVVVIMFSIYLGLNGFRFMLNPRTFEFSPISFVRSLLLGSGVAVLYLAGGWMASGRTYGCHVMGLRVVNFRGRRIPPVTALIRAAFCVYFPIGLVWCAASRANRSLQDVVLRTSVIYDWSPLPPWGPGHPDAVALPPD